jgi:hypothetical protein
MQMTYNRKRVRRAPCYMKYMLVDKMVYDASPMTSLSMSKDVAKQHENYKGI